MGDKIYYSPLSGEELQAGSDGLLHSSYDDLSYMVDSSGRVIPLKSPLDGSELILGSDGLLHSSYDDYSYMVDSSGKVNILKSPLDGSELHLGSDGLFESSHTDVKYIVNDGKIKPLIDPFTGSDLIPLKDGTFQSEGTDLPFMYDSIKDSIVPLFVPDNTDELGHIEDGMLVGNETGRRFEIDPNGIILTPKELAFREIRQQEVARFNEMVQDGSIEDYLNDVKQKEENKKPLSKDDLRQILNSDLPGNVDDLRQMRDQVKPQAQQSSTVAATQDTMTINEFLNKNNIHNESDFTNYLKTMGMDEQIANRLGMVSETNFMRMLGQDMNAQISVIDKGNGNKALYVPTTIKSEKALSIEISQNGNLRVIDNVHSPVMIDGIRCGNINVIDMSMGENGDLNMVESHHEVVPSRGPAPADSKIRFQVTSKQTPVTITSNGEINQSMGVNRQSILEAEDGVLRPVQQNDMLKEDLQQLRDMGFDEKYFTKPNIVGVNYDENGLENIVHSENLQNIPEIGINKSSFSKPTDSIGEYRDNMARIFEQERYPNSILHSQYTVEYGEKPVCHHQLDQISGNERVTLQQQTFDYNDDFRAGLLEPSITDYAERSPIMNQQVVSEPNNPALSSYQSYSENNNILSVNNIDTNYANNLAASTRKVEPVAFNQQQAMNVQPMGMEMGGPVLTKTLGFIDPVILAIIVGFITGLLILITMILFV